MAKEIVKVKQEVGSQVTTGILDRLKGAVRSYIADSGWFPVGSPLPPQAPAGTGVREFDYPVHYNMATTPRQEEKISFPELRSLADNYDLLRLLIETAKDQLSRQKWVIRMKIAPGDKPSKVEEAAAKDQRIKDLTKLFNYPDGENCWRDWIRMVYDEMFVTDAVSILPRFKFGGNTPYAFDVIDGGTIRRVLSSEGKTPLYPDVAYQQVIKGMPSVNIMAPNNKDKFTPQLVYRPRNKRTYKVYGFSPVEQIIMTVNIALRRQVHQLEWYTEGNMPDALIAVPDSWTPDQIKKFDDWWNSIYSGNTAERRKGKFVPGGANGQLNVEWAKPIELKDPMDEWLARIVAFAFSIPPNALIQQMNRSTAESNLEEALAEGLEPRMLWFEDIVNFIIAQYFGYDDLEFTFTREKHMDPKDQSEIHDKYLRSGVYCIDDVLKDLGKDPIGDTQHLIYTAGGAMTLEEASMSPDEKDKRAQAKAESQAALNPNGGVPAGGGAAPPAKDPKGAPAGKATTVKKKFLRISAGRITPSMTRHGKAVSALVTKFFEKEKGRISKKIVAAYKKLEKAKGDKVLADLNLDSWTKVADIIKPTLETTFQEGADSGVTALADLGVVAGDAEDFAGVEKAAVSYAEKRSAKLVKGITKTTRDRLRDLIEQAVSDGLSPDELATAIEGIGLFSEARAEMITRTELAAANVAGNMEAWRESGVVEKKKWIVSDAHESDDECDENEAEEEIDLEESFSSGDDGPPAHPNCLCDVVGITDSGGFGSGAGEEIEEEL